MNIERARPVLCESLWFPCPCFAQIFNRNVGRWYCAYCTSRSYNALNRCCRCNLPGRCINKDTGDWFCEEHGHQCDVLVPRPPGCGWPARNLPCSQLARMFHHDGHCICDDHLAETSVYPSSLAFRTLSGQFDSTHDSPSSSLANLNSGHGFLDLNSFSTVVERECPICLVPKVRWRRLRVCGHEVCEECLAEQVRSSLRNRFLCPFDRRPLLDVPSA